MNFAMAQRILGLMLMIFSLTMLPPIAVSLLYADGHWQPFLASAAIIGVILVVVVPLIDSTAGRAALITGGVLFVLAIGWSRIYLGVHWFTDVIAGWLTGVAWLVLCLTVREVWRQTVGSLPVPPDQVERRSP